MLSERLLAAIPESRRRYRKNCERLVDICRELVSGRPAQEPLTPVVTELAFSRYKTFPDQQTLLNYYGGFLKVWRDAFQDVVNASAPRPKKEGALIIAEKDLAALDAGTRAQVSLLQAILGEQKAENDRLKMLLRERVAAPGCTEAASAGPAPRVFELEKLRGWLASLESGGALEIVPDGLRITRRARPGQVVVPVAVLEELRRIDGANALASRSGSGEDQ